MSGQYGDGGSAHPIPGHTEQQPPSYQPAPIHHPSQPGMSLRDHFAGEALAGMVSHPGFNLMYNVGEIDDIGRRCFELADQLIKARNY